MNFSLKPIASVALALTALVAAHAADEGNWITSYPQALKLSAKTGKPVLANFTGTSWCIYCQKLEGEVFSKPEFKKWAAKNVILLKLDYPAGMPDKEAIKKSNPALFDRLKLLDKYPVRGFPTIYFLNATGKAFGMYGYEPGGPTHWTSMADRLVQPHSTSGSRALRFSNPKSGGYPPYTSKNLYADNDFRGKTAPKLLVEKWLTGKAPETAGKVVLIDLWATWCPGCRELIPEAAAWQKKFKKDLVVIGISDESAAKVAGFMKTTSMPYNVAVDSKQTIEKALGVNAIPQVIVITPDHIVRWQGFPGEAADPLNEKVLAQIIETSKKQSAKS